MYFTKPDLDTTVNTMGPETGREGVFPVGFLHCPLWDLPLIQGIYLWLRLWGERPREQGSALIQTGYGFVICSPECKR